MAIVLSKSSAVCCAALFASSYAVWVLLRRRRHFERQLSLANADVAATRIECDRLQSALIAARAQHDTECERLRAECDRLNSALTVAMRRETDRAIEAHRHEALFVDEREALEAAREALALAED